VSNTERWEGTEDLNAEAAELTEKCDHSDGADRRGAARRAAGTEVRPDHECLSEDGGHS